MCCLVQLRGPWRLRAELDSEAGPARFRSSSALRRPLRGLAPLRPAPCCLLGLAPSPLCGPRLPARPCPAGVPTSVQIRACVLCVVMCLPRGQGPCLSHVPVPRVCRQEQSRLKPTGPPCQAPSPGFGHVTAFSPAGITPAHSSGDGGAGRLEQPCAAGLGPTPARPDSLRRAVDAGPGLCLLPVRTGVSGNPDF